MSVTTIKIFMWIVFLYLQLYYHCGYDPHSGGFVSLNIDHFTVVASTDFIYHYKLVFVFLQTAGLDAPNTVPNTYATPHYANMICAL